MRAIVMAGQCFRRKKFGPTSLWRPFLAHAQGGREGGSTAFDAGGKGAAGSRHSDDPGLLPTGTGTL
jgi:hypothetical protein